VAIVVVVEFVERPLPKPSDEGYIEARLDAEDVKACAPDVERLVEGARRVLEGGRSA
jgi:hypothetical protein